MIKDLGGRMEAKKDVSEILVDNNVDLASIESMIWSRAHTDHVGRPSLFPPSTSLVVGPGIKKSFYPGCPAVQNSPVLAREFKGREVRELEFNTGLTIGGFDALDYFGDDPDETPFCTIPETPSGQPILALGLQQARDTVKKVQKFDAGPGIFVIAAHDASLHGVVDLFPLDASNWNEKGWKQQGQWKFLHDFAGLLETA
ncbi:hypothetical protein INS49_010137 [Diaporthe citri]|uniref:uncharacterized protein n=1 Tax=Diaporthe citri TaxID=83186 RepID=UPI001C80A06D|nr:uncharacterized protein INS49_010137 [Diaporthe citri]KAG6361908.1 hypothetical protein INS49_010137 [Diaporthe citri]